ncbi:Set2 Rpb1 interacting domain-containing protein [Biscogniauxia marginata]|nr:Set2 Rpb1 interacting domain-containing protein [Biscogniauxia marginata]
MDKFRHKLPKEDLKKFAKEINKKLVASDYKNNRVEDPTSITEKQGRKVKKYVKDFFDRAVEKYKAHETKKAERAGKDGSTALLPDQEHINSIGTSAGKDDADIVMTDDDEDASSTPSSSDRKRKRDDDVPGSPSLTPSETPSLKRLKEDEGDVPSPPPPPPPPPEGEFPLDQDVMEQDLVLREQEVALMQENEEAQRIAEETERQKLREEEAALEKENELNMLDFERQQLNKQAADGNNHVDMNGTSKTPENGDREDISSDESRAMKPNTSRKKEVVSH